MKICILCLKLLSPVRSPYKAATIYVVGYSHRYVVGRALLDESPDDLPKAESEKGSFKRGRSMIDLDKQSSAEIDAIQKAVMQREGLILDILSVLRRIPRRVLMVLKLNDLTRLVAFLWCFCFVVWCAVFVIGADGCVVCL